MVAPNHSSATEQLAGTGLPDTTLTAPLLIADLQYNVMRVWLHCNCRIANIAFGASYPGIMLHALPQCASMLCNHCYWELPLACKHLRHCSTISAMCRLMLITSYRHSCNLGHIASCLYAPTPHKLRLLLQHYMHTSCVN